jgi:allantoicase
MGDGAAFRRYPDLASERVGGSVVYANDEFFAPKERLLDPHPAVFDPDRYTDRGKWMDGWETRRRRVPGNDWCVVRLGIPGVIRGIVVDTAHFKGNHPESASVEACELEDEPRASNAGTWEAVHWEPIVAQSPLAPDAANELPVEDRRRWTHVRLSIFPDGGVARLRVHGEPTPDWARLAGDGPVDLAAVEHGGRVLGASDEFFSAPQNLLMPGASTGMHDGWETRRRRGPGHDWVVIRLGRRGRIARVEIDTHHFKGNFPESASLETADSPADQPPEDAWAEILPRAKLDADDTHVFAPPRIEPAWATHVRLRIYPDGGVSRLRVYGEVEP